VSDRGILSSLRYLFADFIGEDDAGKVYFIEILMWKDHDKPDNAPPDVTAIWAQMEALCEKRDGHRGIEFHEVRVIQK